MTVNIQYAFEFDAFIESAQITINYKEVNLNGPMNGVLRNVEIYNEEIAVRIVIVGEEGASCNVKITVVKLNQYGNQIGPIRKINAGQINVEIPLGKESKILDDVYSLF